MRPNVTKMLMSFIFLIGLVFDTSQAQIFFETGKMGIRLSNAGAIRVYAPSTNDDRQMERVCIITAQSEQAVSDYNENHDVTTDAYILSSPTVADTEAVVEFNSNYAPIAPPAVDYRLHVYSWVNEPYIIARFTVINASTQEATLHVGLVSVPRVSGSYGGETNNYNADHRTAYCYRVGEIPFTGLRLLSAEPSSYHALDWSVYSPADPNSDAATDSTRYHMTVDAGFDGEMTAGGDGSLLSLNNGSYTLAAGDSAIVYYAIAYGESETDLMAATDAAQTKYDNTFTAIEEADLNETPGSFSLQQNYPNPFNPNTIIQFNLDQASDIQLNVYDLTGRFVNNIAAGNYGSGVHQAVWNGKDSRGNEVASGIYLYRLTAGTSSLSKKMILMH